MCIGGVYLYGMCINLIYNIVNLYIAIAEASTLAGAIAAAGCVLAVLLLGAVAIIVTCCYCHRWQLKKRDSHSTMDIINEFILR
jgi:hypothetical protein